MKRAYIIDNRTTEVVDLLIKSTEIVVTGVESVEVLSYGHKSTWTGGFHFLNVEKVQLISILPSIVLNAIAQVGQDDQEADSQPALSMHEYMQSNAWLALQHSVTRLKNLRTFRIWLDCDGDKYWANIDEGAVLSALEPLACQQSLDFSIDLPRHWTDDKPLLPFTLSRRLRQRHQGYIGFRGELAVKQRPDFPIIEVGEPDFEEFDQAQLEEFERKMWSKGIDIEEEILRQHGVFIHRGVI